MDIKSTVDLQNELNIKTCGEGWTSCKTNKGRDIDWFRCTYMECSEAINSAQWKHWKSLDTPDDIDNIRMEIVDIWHFVLSILIQHKGIESTKKYLETHLTSINEGDKFSGLERLMLLSLERNPNAIGLLHAFSTILGNWGMSVKGLTDLYVIKNVLNIFRQDNGYKEGSYIKNWSISTDSEDFVEDNEVIKRLANKAKTSDELYDFMNTHYNLVKIINTSVVKIQT